MAKEYTFRLLRGAHQQTRYGKVENYVGGRGKNSVVLSNQRLDLRFGTDRFALLSEAEVSDEEVVKAAQRGRAIDQFDTTPRGVRVPVKQTESSGFDAPKEKVEKVEEVDLEAMTIAQLREFAEQEEIDLEHATRKDEIIKTIETELEAR